MSDLKMDPATWCGCLNPPSMHGMVFPLSARHHVQWTECHEQDDGAAAVLLGLPSSPSEVFPLGYGPSKLWRFRLQKKATGLFDAGLLLPGI